MSPVRTPVQQPPKETKKFIAFVLDKARKQLEQRIGELTPVLDEVADAPSAAAPPARQASTHEDMRVQVQLRIGPAAGAAAAGEEEGEESLTRPQPRNLLLLHAARGTLDFLEQRLGMGPEKGAHRGKGTNTRSLDCTADRPRRSYIKLCCMWVV